MNYIDHGHPLMMEGRALRDKLKLSGEHPDVLRKLDHIVDLKSIHGGTAQKLKNLIALVGAVK